METATATGRNVVRVSSVVAFGSRFGKYKPEEEKEVRKIEVKEDEVLRQLKAAWRRFASAKRSGCEDALKAVGKLKYSAADVEKFSIALVEFQDESGFGFAAGYFLSALINRGGVSDYVIHTRHLAKKIYYLGIENYKNITVNGDVGGELGYLMKSRSIIVNGNVESNVGKFMKRGTIIVAGNVDVGVGEYMKGGTIIVNGNATDGVGTFMGGGAITVQGDASGEIGFMMYGGEIRIEGEIGRISPTIRGGKIYHKGKLIVDNGERIS